MQCVILAGGQGTAMKAVTENLPASLIPIRNRPFLHYQLVHLAKQGIQNILLCVGYGEDSIERYAEDGRAWGLTIRYVKEGSDLHGTGGALRLAYEQNCLEKTFFVLSGNIYFPTDYLPLWSTFETRTEPALLVVTKNAGGTHKAHAHLEGQKITRYDKSPVDGETIYSACGLSILHPAAIEEGIPPKSVYALEDLFQKLSERGKLAGFESPFQPYNIGTPSGYEDFEVYAAKSL